MGVLSVKNLTKKFGNFVAVDDLSFDLHEGEILGFLGPNGAGKTTTIQMLLGVMDPTHGSISYFGKPFYSYREEILKVINFSSGYISFPWLLTVDEILDVFARLYQVSDKKKKINQLLEIFEIDTIRKKKFHQLSAGQKSRVFPVKAFLNYPKIILLDEPTASLDPDIAVRVRQFLKKEREEFNVSILFTSHNMPEVEEMCDRIIFINHGKIVTVGTPDEIAKNIKDRQLQLMITQDRAKALSLLKKYKYVFTENKRYITITLSEQKISTLLQSLAHEKIEYQEISIEKPDLEDFFIQILQK